MTLCYYLSLRDLLERIGKSRHRATVSYDGKRC